MHKVSKDIPPAHAAFTEPLSCSLHAVQRAAIAFEDVVVVAGCGPIGLGMIAGAAAKGPAHVVALDMEQHKLELARACGADTVVDIAEQDPVALIESLTDGYGADVYLEGTGHPSAVGQGLGRCASTARSWSTRSSRTTSRSTGASSPTTRSSTSSARISARTAGPPPRR